MKNELNFIHYIHKATFFIGQIVWVVIKISDQSKSYQDYGVDCNLFKFHMMAINCQPPSPPLGEYLFYCIFLLLKFLDAIRPLSNNLI